MSKIMSNTSLYMRQGEHELQEKIRGLENSMMFLLNRLNEEKQKLNDVITSEIKSDIAATTPALLPPPAVEDNQDAHLPGCPMSRLVLEIDPNCTVHGHLYKKHNIHTMEPQVMIPADDGVPRESSYLAGGDIENRRVQSKKTEPEDYISDSFQIEALKSWAKYSNLKIFQTKESIEKNDNLSDASFEINSDVNYDSYDESVPPVMVDVIDKAQSSADESINYSPNMNELNDTKAAIAAHYQEQQRTEMNANTEDKRQMTDILEALKNSYYQSFLEELPIDLLRELVQHSDKLNCA